MNNILFMYISTTGIHAFLQSAGWGLARLNWGNLLPTEYKKDADAAVPLSDLKASYTRTKDNDNSRHPRQSFIYNTYICLIIRFFFIFVALNKKVHKKYRFAFH